MGFCRGLEEQQQAIDGFDRILFVISSCGRVNVRTIFHKQAIGRSFGNWRLVVYWFAYFLDKNSHMNSVCTSRPKSI